MNLVGKIITILILLLSVCFLMIGIMVNASHQNWKQLALDNKAKVEALSSNRAGILRETAAKNQVIESEKVARMMRVQQLESQLQLARRDNEQANKELAAQRVKAQETLILAKEKENRIAEQDGLIDNLQVQLRTLTEDVAEQREKVVALTGQIFEQNTVKRNLEARRNELTAEVTLARKVMTKNGLTVSDLTDHIPRELQGLVTAINKDFIALSLGEDDGLLKGHTVDLYRDNQFIGAATVTTTERNRSAARINKAMTKVPVQVNDKFTTTWVLSQK